MNSLQLTPTSPGAVSNSPQEQSPAPTLTKPPQAIGRQLDSRKKSALGATFSKGARFPTSTNRFKITTENTTKVQRGLGRQVDIPSEPVFKFSACSRALRDKSGNFITKEDRGPLARFDAPRLPHNKLLPIVMDDRKYGS